MRVTFRTDASVAIGTGHVMRCLTLANALRARGGECHFVTRALPGHLGQLIVDQGFDLSLLAAPSSKEKVSGPPVHAPWACVPWEQDLAETRAVVSKVDWLVIDHYAFDARWQSGLADRADRTLVIDDLADRPHAATLLLDQNLGREAHDYDGLVPEDCRRLIGPRFAMLRPEFSALRTKSLARRGQTKLSHLMISMGGTDVVDATSTVLRALTGADLPPDLRLTVVMGSRAPALDSVRELSAQMPWPTNVLVDVKDMASLMADADLAIGAGGSTTWERCCLGLPTVVVETAANQACAVARIQNIGAALGTGPLLATEFRERLLAGVERACTMRDELSARAAQICDGDGASRVADRLLAKPITVRKAQFADAENVWRWRNDGAALVFYRNPNPTPLTEHLAWFDAELSSAKRDLLIVEVGGAAAAHVRLDKALENTNKAEVSIYLNPSFRGKGLAADLLSAALNSQYAEELTHCYAQVHVENTRSSKVFVRAGFGCVSRSGDFLKLGHIKPSADGNETLTKGRGFHE